MRVEDPKTNSLEDICKFRKNGTLRRAGISNN